MHDMVLSGLVKEMTTEPERIHMMELEGSQINLSFQWKQERRLV